MSAGHTPGPWVYSPARDIHDSIIHTTDAVEEYGYIGSENGGVVGSSEWIWIKPEDARLIAAAPDLLAALEDCVALLSGDISGPSQHSGIVSEARAAIKRAKGEV